MNTHSEMITDQPVDDFLFSHSLSSHSLCEERKALEIWQLTRFFFVTKEQGLSVTSELSLNVTEVAMHVLFTCPPITYKVSGHGRIFLLHWMENAGENFLPSYALPPFQLHFTVIWPLAVLEAESEKDGFRELRCDTVEVSASLSCCSFYCLSKIPNPQLHVNGEDMNDVPVTSGLVLIHLQKWLVLNCLFSLDTLNTRKLSQAS